MPLLLNLDVNSPNRANWLNGHRFVQILPGTGKEPIDTILDVKVATVQQFAREARGEFGTFATPRGEELARLGVGRVAVLDREVVGDALPEMCREFKRVAPGIVLTTYGFFGDRITWDMLEGPTYAKSLKLCRPIFEDLREYLEYVDFIDIPDSYLGRDNTKQTGNQPKDDARDCKRCIGRMQRFVRIAHEFYPNVKLNMFVKPTMSVFGSNENPPIPEQFIEPYVIGVGGMCQAVTVLNLLPEQTAFAGALERVSN